MSQLIESKDAPDLGKEKKKASEVGLLLSATAHVPEVLRPGRKFLYTFRTSERPATQKRWISFVQRQLLAKGSRYNQSRNGGFWWERVGWGGVR